MSFDILSEQETTPAVYPEPPVGLSQSAALIDAATVWHRIETWTAQRWTPRTVTWVVYGGGCFVPRLTPAVLTKAEQWSNDDWQEFTPASAPLGLKLDGGTYRLTFTVGDNATVPVDALEAYRRLAEYWAETQGNAGLTSVKDGDFAATFSASAAARALQYSGAADLLRAYR